MNKQIVYTFIAVCILACTLSAQYMIVEPGTYVVVNGASLVVQGNLEINGNMSFSPDAALVLKSSNDIDVKGLGHVSNMKVETYGSVYLHPHNDKRRTVIEKTLQLDWGALIINDGDLVLDTDAKIIGGSDTSLICTVGDGMLVRQWKSPGTFIYPLGDNNRGVDFTPAKITMSSGQNFDAEIGVRVVDARHDHNDSPDNYINRCWILDAQGTSVGSIDAEFTYAQRDVVGDELALECARWDGTVWHIEDSVQAGTNKLIALDTEPGTFTAGEAQALPVPSLLNATSFGITNIFPNPAKGITTIHYSLHKRMNVVLGLHNQLGERVVLIEEGMKNPGLRTTQLNTNSLPSGTYYLRLSSATTTKTRTMQIVK